MPMGPPGRTAEHAPAGPRSRRDYFEWRPFPFESDMHHGNVHGKPKRPHSRTRRAHSRRTARRRPLRVAPRSHRTSAQNPGRRRPSGQARTWMAAARRGRAHRGDPAGDGHTESPVAICGKPRPPGPGMALASLKGHRAPQAPVGRRRQTTGASPCRRGRRPLTICPGCLGAAQEPDKMVRADGANARQACRLYPFWCS